MVDSSRDLVTGFTNRLIRERPAFLPWSTLQRATVLSPDGSPKSDERLNRNSARKKTNPFP